MNQENVEVRGHSLFSKPASTPIKTLATIIDACIVLLLSIGMISTLNLSPLPRITIIGVIAFIGAAYFFGQKKYFGITCGARVWQLKSIPNQDQPNRRNLFQRTLLSPSSVFVGVLLTTLSVLTSVSVFNELILKHPILISASQWKMEPFVPTPKEWLITPFFYTLGGWPKTFNKKSVLYTLPYEKGPPTRFIGKVNVDLASPDIRLTIEGPKTPAHVLKQSDIRECILNSTSFSCLKLRETILSRHLKEIHSVTPRRWTLKWFQVENPMLPPENQAQGVYLSASGINWIQDRFILINSLGTHQTIILNRTKDQLGDLAFETIQNTIRSFRIFEELDSGRAWVNREIESVHLDDIKDIQNSTILTSNIVDIQGLLISRISVDPASYDSYFHLAGTSIILAKRAANSRDGIKSASIRNIQSAYQYASDISPYDPRTTQIQNMMSALKQR